MRYAQSSACSSRRSSAIKSAHRISHPTVVQAVMVVVTTRPRRKPNTTSDAFGVERKDSLTPVTSSIASAHTKPASGHPPDNRCPPGRYRYGNLLAARVTGRTERPPPPGLSLADWFAVDCPREINSRRVFRRHVDLDRPTGRRYALWRSQPVGSLPFFPAPSRAANRAELGRFHFSLLRLLPELSQLGLEVGRAA